MQSDRIIAFLASIAFVTAVPLSGAGKTMSAPQLPSSVDNSTLKYFPPVFSQLGGSCAQASTVGYVFTYEMNRLLDRDASASPANRFNYLYTWNLLNGGSDEGTYTMDGYSTSYFNGMMTEEDFPKETSVYQFCWASGYDKYYRAMHYRATRTVTMEVTDSSGIVALKRYLYDRGEDGKPGGIVSFSSAAEDWKFNNDYQGPSLTGYHCLLTKLATDGGHAMTIVGYDDSVQCLTDDGALTYGAFIAVNSWGFYYHDRGHYYLPYHFFASRPKAGAGADGGQLSNDVSGVDVNYLEPEIVFKVDMDYTSRDDIAFAMGIADKPWKEKPMTSYIVNIFTNAGGDYMMQGSQGPSSIELAFNFSDYAARLEGMKEPKFFLNISRVNRGFKTGQGSVSAVEVYDYRAGGAPVIYRSPDAKGLPLAFGDNIFGIPTTPLRYTPASTVAWLDKYGKPLANPFVVRTVSGRYAKLRFTGYDAVSGKVKFIYVISSGKEGSFQL